MGSQEDKLKHYRRRENHFAKDLRTAKYKQRIVKQKQKDNLKDKEYDNE